ncbi:jg16225 [Pararge aegeria aegeria]|uniref:Jg16225 protein n=1 Tax=Pararge aegeria aegeria TaxID=348720 RepID=A0A8S4RU34_9NEOP|nr:jg16225 [Pararge aegeria aegeria]
MFASTTFLAIASNLLIADGATTLQELKISDADSSVPESCKHRVFCLVKPDDYPQETIDYIVDDSKALLQPAPQDELTQQLLFVNDEGYDMINCPSEVTVSKYITIILSVDIMLMMMVLRPTNRTNRFYGFCYKYLEIVKNYMKSQCNLH